MNGYNPFNPDEWYNIPPEKRNPQWGGTMLAGLKNPSAPLMAGLTTAALAEPTPLGELALLAYLGYLGLRNIPQLTTKFLYARPIKHPEARRGGKEPTPPRRTRPPAEEIPSTGEPGIGGFVPGRGWGIGGGRPTGFYEISGENWLPQLLLNNYLNLFYPFESRKKYWE
jgi:hypothetical protein